MNENFYYLARDIKEVKLENYFKKIVDGNLKKVIKENEKILLSYLEVEKYVKEELKKKRKILKYSEFKKYYENGNRSSYEQIYFENRKRLFSFVIAYLYEEDKKLLEIIENELFEWCKEFSWELPAHIEIEREKIKFKGIETKEDIGLFSAETGLFLSEILLLLEKKIDENLVQIIKKEINIRILKPFLTNTYWWEKADFNWSSVCSGAIGIIGLINVENKQELNKIINKTLKCYKSYFLGFDNDGYTKEGLSYWEYGVSFFLYFSEWINFYLDKKVNIEIQDKLEKILTLTNSFVLKNGKTISFSDFPKDSKMKIPSVVIADLIKRNYELDIQCSDEDFSIYDDHTFKFSKMIRYFMIEKEIFKFKIKKIVDDVQIYKESQIYIFKNNTSEEKCVAIKGGNNNEPHNHNDLGSFILIDGEKDVLIDLGAGLYTKNYFDNQKRYKEISCKSSFHNTVIIDGKEQMYGEKYFSKSIYKREKDKNFVNVNLSKGYPIKELKYNRNFAINDDITEIIIEDIFSKDYQIDIIFITEIEPNIIEEEILIVSGTTKWKLSNTFTDKKVEEFIFNNHFDIEKKYYRIIFSLNGNYSKTVILKEKEG